VHIHYLDKFNVCELYVAFGGINGALGGALTGAAVGGIVGLIGGPIGSVIGAGIGAAIGGPAGVRGTGRGVSGEKIGNTTTFKVKADEIFRFLPLIVV
jgi:hypothetical protein